MKYVFSILRLLLLFAALYVQLALKDYQNTVLLLWLAVICGSVEGIIENVKK